SLKRTLVFTRTKRGANKVAEQLNMNFVKADAIHGNKAQSARERALENFKRGLSRVLVATDIAARGIDVDDVTHVVNYDMPDVPENCVHRIGRTARAGAGGIAIAFCAPDEREELRAVEKLIRLRIPVKPVPSGIAHPAPPSTPGAFGSGPRPVQAQAQAQPQAAAPAAHRPAPQPHHPHGSPAPAHPVAGRPAIPRRILWRKRRDR